MNSSVNIIIINNQLIVYYCLRRLLMKHEGLRDEVNVTLKISIVRATRQDRRSGRLSLITIASAYIHIHEMEISTSSRCWEIVKSIFYVYRMTFSHNVSPCSVTRRLEGELMTIYHILGKRPYATRQM